MEKLIEECLRLISNKLDVSTTLEEISKDMNSFVNSPKMICFPIKIIIKILQLEPTISIQERAKIIKSFRYLEGEKGKSLIFYMNFKNTEQFLKVMQEIDTNFSIKHENIFESILDENYFEIYFHILNSNALFIINEHGETPLMKAVAKGNLEIVKFFIRQKAQIDAQTIKGSTALCYTTTNDNTEIAKFLIKKGAHVDLGGRYKPVIFAIMDNKIDHLKLFIKNGANLNYSNWSLIEYCAIYDRREILEYLMYINCPNNCDPKITLLHLCAANNSYEVMNYIIQHIDEFQIAINSVDNGRETPLFVAAKYGSIDCINILLSNGASPSLQNPLVGAAFGGKFAAFKIFYDLGIDINMYGNGPWSGTPFFYAAMNGNYDIMEFLYVNRAHPYDKCLNEMDGLSHSFVKGKIETLQFFLAHGLEVEIAHFYHAISGNFYEAVKIMSTMFDLNFNHLDGMTPLIFALSKNCDLRIIKVLLQNGANPNVQSHNINALIGAIHGSDYEIIKLLLDFGADPNLFTNLVDEDFFSPIIAAAQLEDVFSMKLLMNYATGHNPSKEVVMIHIRVFIDRCYAVDFLEFLIDGWPDIISYFSKDDDLTPLHYAAKVKNLGAVVALMNKGAAPDLTNKQGLTAIDIAEYSHDEIILRFLGGSSRSSDQNTQNHSNENQQLPEPQTPTDNTDA